MSRESLIKYQAIRARILGYQRPLVIRPLTLFQRAVLSVQYASR